MSTARFGKKWADVDEDDDDAPGASPKADATRFETAPDENGVKMVIEYTERGGKTYKVTKRVQQTVLTSWTNRNIQERKTMKKFGKAATNDAATEKHLIVKSNDDVFIEISKKMGVQVNVRDEEENKFYEESLSIMEGIIKEKKVWTDMNRARQDARDEVDAAKPEEEKKEVSAADAAKKAAVDAAKPSGGSSYVPPSLRGAGALVGGKAVGKGKEQQDQEASLRITNLSEDCKEGDLQDLFGQFGRLQRVYIAKDQETFLSRGFAFITYYTREDAQRAINKLHGHGYDNLILQVQFAKPRA